MLEDIKIVLGKADNAPDFGGLYRRGVDDNIPAGHFRICSNAAFDVRQVSRRPGMDRTFNFTFYPQKLFVGVIDYDHFFLIQDSEKKIHRDAGDVIMTSLCFDFSALNLYNRIYISPNDAGFDITGQYLWVYTGTGNARLAGGEKPASGVACAEGAAGVVSKGLHKFGVCFVTDTGFITPPNATLTEHDAAGEKAVDLTTIPLGPAECVGRRIVCTKAGEEELFFVPGTGIIEDNTTEAVTVDFADTDLVASADYLNDIYERIPAGSQLVFYKGRLIVVGGSSLVLASKVTDPETFSRVDGFLAIPSEDYLANPPLSGWVLRDTLYISKFPGVYGVQDSGDENPNNWPVSVVDETIGCYPNGIGSYTAQYPGRNVSDYDIILTQQGVFLFDGVFRFPPLTWKIEDIWKDVIQAQINNPLGVNYEFWRMTLSHDVVNKRFYINCSLADIDPISNLQYIILYADYAVGEDPERVKWAMWNFHFRPSVAVMALHPVDNTYTLRVTACEDTKLWSLARDAITDDGVEHTEVLETGLLDKETGMVTFFLGVQLRARGDCTLTVELADGVNTFTAVDLEIISEVMRDYLRLTNFTSEKARLKLTARGPLDINRIEVKCRPIFLQRPQV